MTDRLADLAREMVDEAARRVDHVLGELPHSHPARLRARRAAKALIETAVEAELGRHEHAEQTRLTEPPATPG